MKKCALIALAVWVVCLWISAAGLAYSEVLDSTEEQAMAETLQHALEYNSNGRESFWNNPDTGHSGSVVPFNRFVDTGGLTCREYVATLFIDGEEEREYGTACRKADGRWMVVLGPGDADYAGKPAGHSYVYVYRDPARYYYPWVYYAPAYYPYRIFFSFVFASHSGHFHRHHFHSGYHYHRPKPVIYKKKPVRVGRHYHRKPRPSRRPPGHHRIKRHGSRPAAGHISVHKHRHQHRPPDPDRKVKKRNIRKPLFDRSDFSREKQREVRRGKGQNRFRDRKEASRYRPRVQHKDRGHKARETARRGGKEFRDAPIRQQLSAGRQRDRAQEVLPRERGRIGRRAQGHGHKKFPGNRGFLK